MTELFFHGIAEASGAITGLYGQWHTGFYGLLGLAVDIFAGLLALVIKTLQKLETAVGFSPVSDTGSELEAPVAPDAPVPPQVGNEDLASFSPPPYKVCFDSRPFSKYFF